MVRDWWHKHSFMLASSGKVSTHIQVVRTVECNVAVQRSSNGPSFHDLRAQCGTGTNCRAALTANSHNSSSLCALWRAGRACTAHSHWPMLSGYCRTPLNLRKLSKRLAKCRHAWSRVCRPPTAHSGPSRLLLDRPGVGIATLQALPPRKQTPRALCATARA